LAQDGGPSSRKGGFDSRTGRFDFVERSRRAGEQEIRRRGEKARVKSSIDSTKWWNW
jgi:hypothetical protein